MKLSDLALFIAAIIAIAIHLGISLNQLLP